MIYRITFKNDVRFLLILILIFLQIKVQGQSKSTNVTLNNRDVYFIPFSHLDLMWAGTREECLSRSNRIITRAIDLAKKQPDFHFLLEDMVFVDNFIQCHPESENLKYLKKFVNDGRIEIAPKWAGIFQNLPGGEVHARNILYGKRYSQEIFHVNPVVSHQGDLPGFTPQYPQILAKSDIPYMVMTRMGPENSPLFRWMAPDGSRTLVWDTSKGYGWGVSLGFHHSDITTEQIERIKSEVGTICQLTEGPVYLPWGVDLWSPNKKLIENVMLLQA